MKKGFSRITGIVSNLIYKLFNDRKTIVTFS